MHEEQITLTEVIERGLQLRPRCVLARSFVGENLVQLHTLKLALGVLIHGADPDVPHPLIVPLGCSHLSFSSMCLDRL